MLDTMTLARSEPGLSDRGEADLVTVETRFGAVDFDRAKALRAHHGLPGFPRAHLFGLAALPDGRFDRLRLLQGLEPGNPGFLVMPAAPANPWVERRDVMQALDFVGVHPEDAVLLFIVSARRTDQGAELSMNLRAPVVVDLQRHTARQVVLANTRYQVRQPL